MSNLIYVPIASRWLVYPRALNHLGFRKHVIEGFRIAYPSSNYVPNLGLYQAIQAVSMLESSYALGWKDAGRGSNNTGAVQCVKCDPSTCFEYKDSHPNPDGTSTLYHVCFKKYPSLSAGVAHQTYHQFRLAETYKAAEQGYLYGVSAGMHASGYYEGFGKTEQDRINGHYNRMKKCVAEIAAACGEPIAFKDMISNTSPPIQPGQPLITNKKGDVNEFAMMLGGISLLRWMMK